jgi:hypothetical protein
VWVGGKRQIDLAQILTDEDVIRLWACASNLEELHQVKELPVDVTANLILDGQSSTQLIGREADGVITYGYGSVYNLDVAFFDENFSGFDAQSLNLFLRYRGTLNELLYLAWELCE